MPTTFVPEPVPLMRYHYERAASEYCKSLPLEHFMESTAQSTQGKITVESLDLVAAVRPDVHVFSELLVQYPKGADLKKIARCKRGTQKKGRNDFGPGCGKRPAESRDHQVATGQVTAIAGVRI